MTHIEPRRIVRVESLVILEWQRMVYQDYGKTKGLLRGSDRGVTRGAVHLAIGVSLSVNGVTHQARLGVNTYAKRVAYVGGGHNLHGQLRHLLELGFLTQQGKLGNGAPILYLSVPCTLMPTLAAVKKNGFLALLDALRPEVLTVTDLGEPQIIVAVSPADQQPETAQQATTTCPDCYGRWDGCAYERYGQCS